jgi:hypothetical protein
MSETYPVLSTEQKLAVRDAQIALVNAREKAREAELTLLQLIKKFADDLAVTAKEFDYTTLTYHD